MNLHKFNILFFSKLLLKLKNQKTVLIGDFNLNFLNHSKKTETYKFLEQILSRYFIPKITLFARLTENPSTLIDNILLNIHGYKTIWRNLTTFSDHLSKFPIIDKVLSNIDSILNYQNWFNEKAFVKDVREVDWPVVTQTGTKGGLENFLLTTKNLIDKYAPLKWLKNKKNNNRSLG